MRTEYIYNIGYSTYEESEYYQLYHKRRYSQEEFEKIVVKAVMNWFKEYEVKKDEKTSFQDIIFSLIEELTKNFGFKKVDFTAEFSVFGWANLLDKQDWEEDRDKQLKMLTKAIEKIIKKVKK